jgi:hypothetical protein
LLFDPTARAHRRHPPPFFADRSAARLEGFRVPIFLLVEASAEPGHSIRNIEIVIRAKKIIDREEMVNTATLHPSVDFRINGFVLRGIQAKLEGLLNLEPKFELAVSGNPGNSINH